MIITSYVHSKKKIFYFIILAFASGVSNDYLHPQSIIYSITTDIFQRCKSDFFTARLTYFSNFGIGFKVKAKTWA